MYLFEDAAKQKRKTDLFDSNDAHITYSSICNEFEQKGIYIFNEDIRKKCIIEDKNEEE